MFWVLFEVLPDKENWDDYLNNTKMLRPELEEIDGFVDNIRYKSPLLLRHRDSHVSRSHIGGAPVEITLSSAMQFYVRPVGAKDDTEMIASG
jgi:hypothetical protein